MAGVELVPIGVDEQGLQVDILKQKVMDGKIRAVYLTPHHQYPTTVVMSPARRLFLLELCRKHGLAIIEDDYDHEFHYDGSAVLPIASDDVHGLVVYIGTLSKILAPGLRIGFVVAERRVLERVSTLRTLMDRQGDLTVERAVAELLEEGEIARHARKMRKVYLERRDCLIDALDRQLPGVFRLRVPPGGIAVWAEVVDDIDVDAWQTRALREGVVFHTGRRFTFDGGPRPFVRLGFAAVNPKEIQQAVKAIAKVARSNPKRRP
jgi:GntR family transcriptional regulator/MocR family aminotransferase